MERKSAWSLPMSEQEIVNEYKAAKKPQNQIAILADQNGCEKKTIVNILEAAGCELPGNYKKRPKKEQPLEETEAADEPPFPIPPAPKEVNIEKKTLLEDLDFAKVQPDPVKEDPEEGPMLAAAYIKAAAYDVIVEHPALWDDGEEMEFIATVSGIRALVKKLIKEA